MVKIEDLLAHLPETDKLELENVEIDVEELILSLKQGRSISQVKAPLGKKKERITYTPPVREYTGEIAEIQLGATKSEGGSRGSVIKIGGQKTLYQYEGGHKNRPVVSFDVFDMEMPSFPKALREDWQEFWGSPGEWAKEAVKRGADLITVHLISADPRIKDTSPRDAAKTVEEVLQAVKVPLVIGGCGSPEKDPLVFEKAAEVSAGERCLIASANLDLDYKKIVDAANKYGHNVLSWTAMDINDQKTLNKLLLDVGLPKERMVLDPTTGALGYGLEYTYTLIERMKESALKGDEELQNPISCGVTNAWAAREAWMSEPKWGPKEYRGPLWETITALTVLSAGADILMMLHPKAVNIVKNFINSKAGDIKSPEVVYEDWLRI